MEVLNLAATALFDSLKRHNIDQELLLKGTHLKLNYMLDVKKKHSWIEFVQMYKNTAELLGPEIAAREIAYHGIYNDKLTKIRNFATGLVDAKTLYWFIAKVVGRHLFKDSVQFNYQKIKSNQIKMEIFIPEELVDCPLLLETYVYLFENMPTLLGLPKAIVTVDISKNKAIYTVKFIRTFYLFYLFSKFSKSLTGSTNAVLLIEEFETQSLQLAKALEEKSELLRIMSHDISNIVSIININLINVLKKENLQLDNRVIIEKAKKNADRLSEILKNIQRLEVAHIRGVNLEAVNIEEVFFSLKEYFNDQLMLKNIKLNVQNNLPMHVKVLAEKSSLEMNVLANLISNAIKFSNNGSNIGLEADFENGEIIISVIDQGKGMSLEDRKDLFTKNLRKSTVGTNGEIGTGFGLGIVNRYVKMYNGKISVEANYPMGTIIKISLKMHNPEFINTIPEFNDSHHINIITSH